MLNFVIEIKRDKGQHPRAGGVQGEGDDAPDLAVQHQIGVKAQVAQQHRVHRAEQPEGHVRDAHIHHQARDAEIGMLAAESVDIYHGILHVFHSFAGETIISFLPGKVYKKL